MEKVAITKKQVLVAREQANSGVNMSPFVGFWPRFAAFIIDSTIVTVVWIISFGPVSTIISIAGLDISLTVGIAQTLVTLLGPLYFIYFTHKSQSTWGKRYMGIKVLAEDGYKLSLGKIILRETVGRLVNMFTMCIGYIFAGFSAKKQGLHDMISGSIVVQIDPAQEISKSRFIFGVLIGISPFLGIFGLIGIYILMANF